MGITVVAICASSKPEIDAMDRASTVRHSSHGPRRSCRRISQGGQVVANDEHLSKIVFMDRSFPYMMEAILNYKRALKLQYGVSSAELLIEDTDENEISLQYWIKQPRSSYVGNMRLGHQMTKNAYLLPLLEFLKMIGRTKESWGYRTETARCCTLPKEVSFFC